MHRLLILTAHPDLYTPRRLLEEAAARSLAAAACEPTPWWRPTSGIPPLHDAAFVTRPGTFSLVQVLRFHRALERAGARPLQQRRTLLDACDQWRTLRRLATTSVPIPPSFLLRSPGEWSAAVAAVPGPPWILKARRGSRGSHVLLGTTAEEARQLTRFHWGQGNSVLVQEDLRPRGPVRRMLVVGERVVASAVGLPARGDFRTNWHRGGEFRADRTAPPRQAEVAREAVRQLGLPFAGVDVIGDERPAVLEVNASPGLEGLEGATGRNLAGELIEHLRTILSSNGATEKR